VAGSRSISQGRSCRRCVGGQGCEATCALRKFSEGLGKTVGNVVPESSVLRKPRNDISSGVHLWSRRSACPGTGPMVQRAVG